MAVQGERRSRFSDWRFAGALGLAVAGVIAVVLVVVVPTQHTKHYRLPSESMVPTFKVGDRIEADLDAYDSSRPQVGDIVVLHPPGPGGSLRASSST